MNADNPAAPDVAAAESDAAAERPAPSPEAEALQRLQTELDAARALAAENQDKFLRARAEIENVRRRAESDVAGAHKYAIERFALEMLAVRDSLERAAEVHAAGDAEQVAAGERARMIEGLDLTLRLLDSVFQKFGLVAVAPAVGERFDPGRHQAMSTAESGVVPANHVLTTVQKGYVLQERLLRPAMVIVARAPAESPSGA